MPNSWISGYPCLQHDISTTFPPLLSCVHARSTEFLFLSPTGRMMAVSVLARPPADSLSVHPIVIVPDPFRKKPVGCRYNKIYCSLSLLLMSECGLVARSVVPGDPGRPPIECGMEGGWAAASAVVSVAHAARSAGSDAETSSTLEPPRSIYLFRPARMPNGAT